MQKIQFDACLTVGLIKVITMLCAYSEQKLHPCEKFKSVLRLSPDNIIELCCQTHVRCYHENLFDQFGVSNLLC